MQPEYAAARRVQLDREYRKQRLLRQLRGEPTSLVTAETAARHATNLVALGWSCAAIAQLAGDRVSDTTVVNLTLRRHDTIERKTAAAILRVPLMVGVPDCVADTAKVPLLGAQRRVHALMRLGWSHPLMRPACGVDTSHIARGTYPQILARKWRAIDALYREHNTKRGPSNIAALRAEAAGHPSPFAWEDIDNPNEKPTGLNVCTRRDCQAQIAAKGLCITHYHQLQNGGHKARTDVDPVIVRRILGGDWKHPANPAEKAEVCRRFIRNGGTAGQLARLTPWKVERYFKVSDVA